MGKWSLYRGHEGKYLVHPASDKVVKLHKYLFQDFYLDINGNKVYIGNLNRVFDNEKEAKILSNRLISEKDSIREEYEKELKLRKEKEEKEREERLAKLNESDYLENMSYSERRYYLD